MSNRSSLLTSLSEGDADVFAAVAGLVVSLALVPLWLVASAVYVLTIPLVVAGACVLYLASVRHPGTFTRVSWTTARAGATPARITGIGIAGLVATVALLGERSLPVLLLAGGLGTLILFQILFLDESSLSPGPILAQTVALALVVRFGALFTTPGLIGVDSWIHVTQYSASIADAGSLSAIADSKYYAAPFYHLVTVAGAQLLDLPVRTALYLVVGSVVVLSALFVYAGARYFTTVRWALFATALFALGDQFIRWGLHVIPTSLGLALFLGVLFYVARVLHADTGVLDLVVLTLLAAVVTLTHQVSAFVTLAFLGAAVVAQFLVRSPRVDLAGRVERRADDVITRPVNLLGVFGFHLGFTALLWSMTPSPTDEPFLVRMPLLLWATVQNSAGFLTVDGSSAAAGTGGTSSSGAWLAPYVDATGFLLLLFVTVIGSLALLRWHRSPQASFTFVGAVAIMLVFTLVLPLFGIETFLPGRWFAFVYAPMVVIGAIGLRHLGGRSPSRVVVAVVVLFALVFPAAMVTAEKATLENPTFEEQWPKYAYSESELAAVGTFGQIVPDSADPVYTDHPYRTVFPGAGVHTSHTITLDDDGRPETFYHFIVYRTYQSSGAPQFVTGSGEVVTGQVTRQQVCPETRNYVYANQDTVLCTRSNP